MNFITSLTKPGRAGGFFHRALFWYKAASVIIGLLLLGGFLVVKVSATLEDYAYQMSVGVANQSGGALTNYPVPVTMQPSNLIDGGFLQDDAEDWLPVTDGAIPEFENVGFAQGMTSNGQTWWVDIPSQADGATATYDFHMGDASATREQRFRFSGADLIETAIGATNVNTLEFEVVFRAVTWPSGADYAILFGRFDTISEPDHIYYIRLDTSGVPRIIVKVLLVGAGWLTTTLTADNNANPFIVGAPYTIRVVWDNSLPSANLKVYQGIYLEGDTLRQSFNYPGDHIAGGAEDLWLGFQYNGYLHEISVTSPATNNSLEYTFEPDAVAETQKGDSGNSWNWLGTVDDQGVNNKDGVYTLVRDTSGITAWTFNLRNKTVTVVTSEETTVNLLGPTAPDVLATQAPVQFLGREQLEAVLENANIGVTALAAWFILLSVLGIGASLLLFKATGVAFLALLPIPVVFWLGWGVGLPMPLWMPIVLTLVAFGVTLGLRHLTQQT